MPTPARDHDHADEIKAAFGIEVRLPAIKTDKSPRPSGSTRGFSSRSELPPSKEARGDCSGTLPKLQPAQQVGAFTYRQPDDPSSPARRDLRHRARLQVTQRDLGIWVQSLEVSRSFAHKLFTVAIGAGRPIDGDLVASTGIHGALIPQPNPSGP